MGSLEYSGFRCMFDLIQLIKSLDEHARTNLSVFLLQQCSVVATGNNGQLPQGDLRISNTRKRLFTFLGSPGHVGTLISALVLSCLDFIIK